MTILFMDGMDLHGVTANLIRRYNTVNSSVTYGATLGRFGGGGITITDDDRFFGVPLAGSPQTAVVSFHLFRSSAANGIDWVLKFDTSVVDGGILLRTLTGGSSISVFRGTTSSLGTFNISLNVWHWVSLKYKAANTGGTFDVEVDGVNVFSFTGDTVNSGTEIITNVRFGADQSQDFTYDDIIVTDIAGSAPFNDLLSERRIDTIMPDAAGDSSGFTASPAVANYLNVDETSPDDDTTYVESGTSLTKDLYNMAAMNFSPSSIDAVNVVALATNPDSGITQFKHKVKSGVTEGTGAAQSPPLGYEVFDEVFLTNPDTAVAWTESDVNGMQAGIEIV